MDQGIYNCAAVVFATTSLIAGTYGAVQLLRMPAEMRSRLLWRQMLVLVGADWWIGLTAFAKHICLLRDGPEMVAQKHLKYLRVMIYPTLGVSIAMEVVIAMGFAAACSGNVWVTWFLRVSLAPGVFAALTVGGALGSAGYSEHPSTGFRESLVILCFCLFALCSYSFGLICTAGAPNFIRRRTCVQSTAYLTNTLVSYLPMSLILMSQPVSAPQMVFGTNISWQIVNLIMALKGTINTCTYMVWVYKESHGRQKLSNSREPSLPRIESAILDTYFSLTGTEDDVRLEADRAVALAVSQARQLRQTERL